MVDWGLDEGAAPLFALLDGAEQRRGAVSAGRPTSQNETWRDLQAAPPDQATALYAEARSRIETAGWDSLDPASVAEALDELHKYDDLHAGRLAQMALWALVERFGRTDVLSALLERNFWWVVARFMAVVPHLSFTPDELEGLLGQLDRQIGGDLAASQVLSAVQRWADLHPWDVVAYFSARDALPIRQALELLRGALYAPATRETVHEMAAGWSVDAPTRRAAFLVLLSDLVHAGCLTRESALVSIRAAVADEDLHLVGAALHSLRRLLQAEPDGNALEALDGLIDDPRPEVKGAVGSLIWMSDRPAVLGRAGRYLLSAAGTDSSHLGVIQELDHVLSGMVQRGDLGPVEPFLKSWVERHPKEPPGDLFKRRRFFSSFHHLAAKHRDLLSGLITRWMLDKAPLARAGAALLAEYKLDRYDQAALEQLDDEGFAAVVDRTLALVLGGEHILCLIASASVQAASPERVQIVLAACEETVVNYPGGSDKFLGRFRPTNAVEEAMVESLRRKREAYYPARESRRELREFFPPPDRFRKFVEFQRRRQSEVEEAIDESGEFVLNILATGVTIGRGDEWVSNRSDGGGFSAPSKFGSFSHEVEMPRLDIIDPEGAEFTRRARLVGATRR